YAALEEAARRTGRRVALIQCGWFANAGIEQAFKAGAASHAPSVRHLWLDGREAAQRARAWTAGDVFVSLSDNIQETYGLTPLEAMAAGLPVLATDWNGYRQTLHHGETGFMVPTLAPDTTIGDGYADDHADGAINYDIYLARTARHVSIDLAALFDAAERLVADEGLRRTMGAAGRKLARERFEWSHLVREYLALWQELARIRAAAQADPGMAPRRAPERLNPFALFGTYPTRPVTGETQVHRRKGGGDPARLLADPLHSVFVADLGGVEAVVRLLVQVPGSGSRSLDELAEAAGMNAGQTMALATVLLKLGVIETA
ncbi:MAG TPA: glycosyltransferase family 4 protein, partial [Novosphingobium sp.]|nr:glycosyltransferase family 4 protein [Novosphingobium sp.]